MLLWIEQAYGSELAQAVASRLEEEPCSSRTTSSSR